MYDFTATNTQFESDFSLEKREKKELLLSIFYRYTSSIAFNEDFCVTLPYAPCQVCRNAAYKLDCSLYILIVFHDFVEGISQTQGTQTEIKQWKE